MIEGLLFKEIIWKTRQLSFNLRQMSEIMFLLFNQSVRNQSDLIEMARTGIPKNAVLKMAKQLSFSGKELAIIINLSERTLQRYPDNKKLEKTASEKAIQLAKLYERGNEVWGDLERFKGWMRHPNPFLSSKTPLEILDTNFGFEMVLDEIGRIEHGILA